MPIAIEKARDKIHRVLDEEPTRVLQLADINRIFRDHREAWRLAMSTSRADFIRFLTGEGLLRVLEMDFPWRKEVRYVWRSAPLAEVLMTLRPQCHFSHFTAMQSHGLTEQEAATVYVNFEQTPKPSPAGGLTQTGIDRAFAGPQRVAKNMTEVEGFRVYLLNGKHTGYVGVETRPLRLGADEALTAARVTDVERTLIDLTVRPDYAGGPDEVLKAYRRAGDRASVNRLAAYLQKMRYVYPYHQAIGFYLEKSEGYSSSAIERFRDRYDFEYDFYLAYGMKDTRYDKRWRLHVPSWM